MTETKGYFGQFGGSFVPEPIQNLLNQLEETFEQYKNDPEFIAEYKHYLKDYSGRETPLYFAESLIEHQVGVAIFTHFVSPGLGVAINVWLHLGILKVIDHEGILWQTQTLCSCNIEPRFCTRCFLRSIA